MNKVNNQEFDLKHIIHPYSIPNKQLAFIIKDAKDCILIGENNKCLIDGMASWWCVIHGYKNPQIISAMQNQVNELSHVMFGGITHLPAINLAKQLIKLTKLDSVFFTDSGSISIEVAVKIAIQYNKILKKHNAKYFLTFRGGYHGDTNKAMSICDPYTGMHSIFNNQLSKNIFLPKPPAYNCEEKEIKQYNNLVESFFKNNHKKIYAFIVEPIIQGAGGMWIYNKKCLQYIVNLCKQYKVLVIFDEIATGFGRLGKLFAYEFLENYKPDILCVGKALTGGYLTGGAVLINQNIKDTFKDNNIPIMHGPTFMGNPLFCNTSLVSIKLLLKSPWEKNIKNIENLLKSNFENFKKQSKIIKDIRIIGALAVIETKDNVNLNKLQSFFIKNGVWIRPFNNLIYIMPPYIIQKTQLLKLVEAMKNAIFFIENNYS